MVRWRLRAAGLIAVGVWASSCSPADFTSETVIATVRILASRATPHPRPKPGASVTVEMLAIDGRVNQVPPMGLYWLPALCINPPDDAYYACFAQLAAGGGGDGGVRLVTGAGADADAGASASADAGADAGPSAGAGADAGAELGPGALAGLLRPGVDLTPLLVSGSRFTFKMPEDVIVPRKGITSPYGLVILFNFACTGHIELLPYDPSNGNPQQIPIGCFDANHNQLGADDFVFGFTRVYASDTSTEENPVIERVDLGGPALSLDGGATAAPFVVPLCADPDAGGKSCDHAIGPVVAPSLPSGKQVWADFYSTVGTFSSTARLLFSPTVTLSIPGDTNNTYTAPGSLTGAPSDKSIWIVVHDDQGGADWVTVPLQFRAADGGASEGGAPSH